jgi:hypothetical protein
MTGVLRKRKVAKVKLNPIIDQVHRQVSDLVFRRYGDTVIGRKPDHSGQPQNALDELKINP